MSEPMTIEELREWQEIADREAENDQFVNFDKDGTRLRPALGELSVWLIVKRLLDDRTTAEQAAQKPLRTAILTAIERLETMAQGEREGCALQIYLYKTRDILKDALGEG